MKAQISIDFMISLALLMILFLFVFEVALDRQDFDRDKIYEMQAKSYADTLARLINSVYQSGDGTIIYHDFHPRLRNNRPYNMTVNPAAYRVEVRWADQFYTAPIQTSNVVADRIQGNVTIWNSGGEIHVGWQE